MMAFDIPKDGQFQYIYDEVYTAVPDYNCTSNRYKYKVLEAERFALEVDGKILDAGCGRGTILQYLTDAKIDIFGVEWSPVCCEKYLADLSHECADLVEFCIRNKETFNGIICTDVLEHFPEERLGVALEAISHTAPKALFGIARNRDNHGGHQLHLTMKTTEWWISLIKKYYARVTHIPGPKPAFFFLECTI